MAAEQKMHNHVTPPAAASRAASTHVLDLTSWCVKSGSVQLPQALLGKFEVGKLIAQSDGGELELEVVAPRTLTGLDGLFAVCGLRANDRLAFSFQDGVLYLTAQKRERQREGVASRAAQRPAQRAEGADAPQADERRSDGVPGSNTPRRRASDWADAVDRQVAQAAARKEQGVDAGPASDRFAGPVGEPVPGPGAAGARARAEQQKPAGHAGKAKGAVTKVRIEGGVPMHAGSGQARPKERWSAHNVWARRENAHWHSLDIVQAADPSEREIDPDFPDTVVRALRRGPNGTLQPEPLQVPAATPEAEREAATGAAWMTMHSAPRQAAERRQARHEGPREVIRSASPVPETRVAPRPLGQLEWEAGPEGRSTAWAERPAYVRAGEAPRTEAPAAGRGEDVAHDHEAAAEPGPGLTEATSPAKPPQRGMMSRLGLRLGIGRERHGATGGSAPRGADVEAFTFVPSAQRAHAPRRSGTQDNLLASTASSAPVDAPRRSEPAQQRGVQARADMAHSAGPGLAPQRPDPVPTRAPEASTSAVATASAVQHALLDHDVLGRQQTKREDPVKRSLAAVAPAPTATVEDDLAFLEGYLMQPGTPAIVRSLDLAEKLGMSPERAARAMDRLAEDRDRFTKIREGAYMVRHRGARA